MTDQSLMDRFLEMLPSAALAGNGAILCLVGFRQLRFHALAGGVLVLAAAGFALGGLASHPAVAVGLCVIGALAGYRLEAVFFYVYVALAAALGGAALGYVGAILTGYSSPMILCGATAVGCAVIALLNARATTIGWTSAAGSALVCLGAHLAYTAAGTRTLAVLFALLFLASVIFQHQTTREAASAAPLLRPEPLRA